jgi:hypothetical protein
MIDERKKKKPQNQFKGPKTYNHGIDSRFVLCILDAKGNWHRLYSRDRPGSRAKKLFTDQEILLHLRQQFTSGDKRQFVVPDAVFAYIGEHKQAQSYKNALYHWYDNGKGWITGPCNHIATFQKTVKFRIGPEQSQFGLHVKVSGQWLPVIYSIDRPNEFSDQVFSEKEIIAALLGTFANGGYKGNSFAPQEVQAAYIYRLANKARLLVYNAVTRTWENTAQPGPATGNKAETMPDTSRLWFMHQGSTRTNVVRFTPDHLRQLELYRSWVCENYPGMIERYTDENGEIHPAVFEAFYWANVAGNYNRQQPIDRCCIYFEGSDQHLVVRFNRETGAGLPYTVDLKGYPDQDFFKTIVPKCNKTT